ncbi:phosphate ABC transporter, permease protein, partial [mine drainage metagenome]
MKVSEAARDAQPIATTADKKSAGARPCISADFLFRNLSAAVAMFVAISLLGILVALWSEGWDALHHFGWKFLVTTSWNPVSEHFG